MITIKKLKEFTALLNLQKLCILAGLNYHSIYSKLRRNRELTVIESEKIKTEIEKIFN